MNLNLKALIMTTLLRIAYTYIPCETVLRARRFLVLFCFDFFFHFLRVVIQSNHDV